MDRELVELFRLQHGVITRQQALDAGLSSRQIQHRRQNGQWETLSTGVYRNVLVPISWHGRVIAGCLGLRGVASHCTAGFLQRLDGIWRGTPEVTVPAERWRHDAAIRLHQSSQFDRIDLVEIDGIPTTGLGRTILDLAAVVGRMTLDGVIDDVLRAERLDLPALTDVLGKHSRKGRDGCGKLRTVLDERLGTRVVPLSKWSRMVANLLDRSGLPAPEFEFVVEDRAGRFVGQVDLAYPRHRIAIELDSVSFHLNRESFDKDPARKNRLAIEGWTVLTFTWRRYVDDSSGLVREVKAALDRKPAPVVHR